ncbi:hypothetical protein N9H41_02610 [Candidatus Pelagibacter sp.]|nr:hypothetical protein [Candidatus Pelagibacter sp.]MDC3308178.1 hypothetical protein [Candidatus Pelagibacter sp.]
MNKTTIATIIYILGVLIGAFFFKVWGAETSFIKTISIFVWTIIFLITLFYADKHEREN